MRNEVRGGEGAKEAMERERERARGREGERARVREGAMVFAA